MAAAKFLGAADLEAAADVSTAEVDCPEWGGRVRVRGLTAAEHLRLAAWAQDLSRRDDCMFWTAACGLLGPDGAPMWPDPAEGVEVLRRRALPPVERVAAAVMALSRVDDEAVEAARKN